MHSLTHDYSAVMPAKREVPCLSLDQPTQLLGLNRHACKILEGYRGYGPDGACAIYRSL